MTYNLTLAYEPYSIRNILGVAKIELGLTGDFECTHYVEKIKLFFSIEKTIAF